MSKIRAAFYGYGQSAADRGQPLEASPWWAARGAMPWHLWSAFTKGFEDARSAAVVRLVVERAKARRAADRLQGSSTGRLADFEPNLQNIPVRTTEGRKIREAFTAGGTYA